MTETNRLSSRHQCADCEFEPVLDNLEPCKSCVYSTLTGCSNWQPKQLTQEVSRRLEPGKIMWVDEIPPNPVPTPETILQEAQRLVHGDRGESYGHPIDDFSRTAAMFNAWKGNGMNLTAEDVAVFMMCVKLSREANRHKRDNLVDACGYAETLMMVRDERMRREASSTIFAPLGPLEEKYGK